ncbi:MAG: TlyA family RNA methyltransferase [Tissierellia bacterium]|nr:TlyA family RNA methyltransferase [Tissierellia bacterium]
MKKRADLLVVDQGLAPSREKAKALIMAGQIFYDQVRVDKAGDLLDPQTPLELRGQGLRYVSRGGLKLEKILEKTQIDLKGKVCVDIGASTGGFTDCMLQHGAQKVYAIDVGYNQLDYRLREDDRVVVMERTNIRYLDREKIQDPIDFISIDVSFIGLNLVLPVAQDILSPKGQIAALIKPQFEAGKDKVGKKGVIRDPRVHREVLEKMVDLVAQEGLFFEDLVVSPIKGQEGNTEFLMLLSHRDTAFNVDQRIHELIKK